jgi:hypothetical protein
MKLLGLLCVALAAGALLLAAPAEARQERRSTTAHLAGTVPRFAEVTNATGNATTAGNATAPAGNSSAAAKPVDPEAPVSTPASRGEIVTPMYVDPLSKKPLLCAPWEEFCVHPRIIWTTEYARRHFMSQLLNRKRPPVHVIQWDEKQGKRIEALRVISVPDQSDARAKGQVVVDSLPRRVVLSDDPIAKGNLVAKIP